MKNGVPQGSILGPLLFTVLLYDLKYDIKFCLHSLYADDTQIYISGKLSEIGTMIKKINTDLEAISSFSISNCLSLNNLKTTYIIIGSKNNLTKLDKLSLPPLILDGKIIKRERVVKNLGVYFDENLSWDFHINFIIGKAYGKLRMSYKHRRFLSHESRLNIMEMYVLSQFNYADVVLQNLSQLQEHKIQLLQNNCVRFICSLRKYDHISNAFNSLVTLNMQNRRICHALTLMHKILKDTAPVYLKDRIRFQFNQHNYPTRNNKNIIVAKSKTNFGRNKFFNFISNKYNSITSELNISRKISTATFKIKIKKYYLLKQIS